MRSRLWSLLAVACVGCNSESPANDGESATPSTQLAERFDPSRTGQIAGRVTWRGAIPNPPPFLYCTPRPDGRGMSYHRAENPNRPRVDRKSRGVGGAVVFLRGIDPARAKSWNLPPVSVEMGGGRITVVQGDRRGRVGFVRRGEEFSAMASEPLFHILRGRGDAYFSLTLPHPGTSTSRRLDTAGRVELSSGTDQYWARGDLFVVDHPYFTVTDEAGRFSFDRVPAGEVEVVVWLPGWEVAGQERNPDTVSITRMSYSAPIEKIRPASVAPGGVVEARFSVP